MNFGVSSRNSAEMLGVAVCVTIPLHAFRLYRMLFSLQTSLDSTGRQHLSSELSGRLSVYYSSISVLLNYTVELLIAFNCCRIVCLLDRRGW